jgi:phospho-N-acetylmuramoyl-pentapeptide-transferase
MLCWLSDNLRDFALGRAWGALVLAFLVASFGGKHIILWLKARKVGERTDKTPIEDAHLIAQISAKAGTPTMGGVIILVALLCACAAFGDLTNIMLWLPIACFAGFAALGAIDDWMKLTGKAHKERGLKVRHKLAVQFLFGGLLGLAYWHASKDGLHAPWPLHYFIGSALLMFVWTSLVVATMSNAVNVTDGMDGLAGSLTLVALLPLGLYASSLGSPAKEVSIFCAALGGAMLGFLWHNWYPARVFMGDTGSLAVGGSLGLVAVMTKTEFLLPFVAAVFLVEFASSVLQVLWFKATGKRILPIAPIHHIWQRRGMPETHVVWRFFIVGLLAGLTGLLLLAAHQGPVSMLLYAGKPN